MLIPNTEILLVVFVICAAFLASRTAKLRQEAESADINSPALYWPLQAFTFAAAVFSAGAFLYPDPKVFLVPIAVMMATLTGCYLMAYINAMNVLAGLVSTEDVEEAEEQA
jgi:hypothetical protein